MTDEQERDNREAHERRELIKSLASEMPSYSDFISRLKKHAELKKLGSEELKKLASKAWAEKYACKRKDTRKHTDAMSRAILTGFETNRRRH